MAEVYIDRLTVENFGPFYGRVTFDLHPVEDRCGILVGGKNGSGKTHLLRAIYLAVVGETGVHDLTNIEKSDPNSSGFRFDKSLNRKAESEGHNLSSLEIEIVQNDPNVDGKRKFTFIRKIHHRPNSHPRWESHVATPEETVHDDTRIQKLRDSLLPRHLARFFFFDAERSQSLHLRDRDIIDGISRILGLWTYEELANELRKLIRNKIPQQFKSKALADESKKLSDISSEISKYQGELQSKQYEENEYKEQLRDLESELAKKEEELRTLGEIDPDELEENRKKYAEIKAARNQLESELAASWETNLPIALLGDLRNELHDYLLKEEKRNEWERSKATVEPKIPQIKSDVFQNIPQEYSLTEETLNFYTERLDKALRSIFHPPPDGMSDRVFAVKRIDSSAQIRQQLLHSTLSIKSLSDLTKDIESKSLEINDLDLWFKHKRKNESDYERSGEIREQIKNLRKQIEEWQTKLSQIPSEIKILENKIKELKREEENQRRVVEKAQKGASLTTHAIRFRESVEDIQQQAAIQLRSDISEMVGDLWIDITDRQLEFSNMEFDNNWNCYLMRQNGNKISWEDANTSAGQRQVRALAFNEALRRLARLVPPLVIDTPLGRLDQEIRRSVLKKLYLCGHQSIMLATNSEIDPQGPLYDSIMGNLARVYTLEPQGEQASQFYTVSLKNDYFGKRL